MTFLVFGLRWMQFSIGFKLYTARAYKFEMISRYYLNYSRNLALRRILIAYDELLSQISCSASSPSSSWPSYIHQTSFACRTYLAVQMEPMVFSAPSPSL
mmetsp:Transcript_13160/g.18249  ORF Transcript_13160/g.18249 Transcript_13160/m.18249 type:complete len:100 (+) Transcript_13160:110-409(+)